MVFIHHMAIWTQDLERLRSFYMDSFEANCSEKYSNPAKGFESYFLTFSCGARLEIMSSVNIVAPDDVNIGKILPGYAHMAFSLGSKEEVDNKTNNYQRKDISDLMCNRKITMHQFRKVGMHQFRQQECTTGANIFD